MALTQTSLIHPQMIAKIRKAMLEAFYCPHKVKKAYVANASGHNILRIDYRPDSKTFIIYGSESKLVTELVRKAFKLHNLKE